MDNVRLAALNLSASLDATAANIQRVSAKTSPDAANWAFTQRALRKAAKGKFALANEMLFTREALEQSTSEAIAAYHASRFPAGTLVADLTAGIGADLIALAKRGPSIGFEIDEERATYGAHNLQVHRLEASVRVLDCFASEWDFPYAFADPSRRSGGRRVSNLEDFVPNPVTLAERLRSLDLGGMKLSPMLPDGVLDDMGDSIEFVSYGWECREALLWFGNESKPGRRAVKVETGVILNTSPPTAQSLQDPEEYLLEADPAAIRAHCLGELCTTLNAHPLGDSNGYLTSKTNVSSDWVKSYRVIEYGHYDARRIGEALRSHSLTVDDVKTRGVKQDFSREKRQWKNESGSLALVAIYPVAKSLRFAILVPVTD